MKSTLGASTPPETYVQQGVNLQQITDLIESATARLSETAGELMVLNDRLFGAELKGPVELKEQDTPDGHLNYLHRQLNVLHDQLDRLQSEFARLSKI